MAIAVVLGSAVVTGARAENQWLLQGLADAEAWSTGGGSELLERNEDRTAGAGGFRLLAAWEPLSQLQILARGRVEGGRGSVGGETDERLELALVRYSWGSKTRFMAQAGRIGMPVTAFSRRYLPNQNPLIGSPAGYEVSYPNGAEIDVWHGPFDAMAALVDRPPSEGEYVPEAETGYRPALGVGVTPAVGLRFGATYTQGPYLGSEPPEALPDGSHGRDYRQRSWGGQLQLARGYFELNGEFLSTRYEVPTQAIPGRGCSWYVEPKYAWTPRLFTALRVESVRQPYIEFEEDEGWENEATHFSDVEAGVGYRLMRQMLLKVSYRVDRWRGRDETGAPRRDGRALAMQISYGFDLGSGLMPVR